jgi:hypothetical protein
MNTRDTLSRLITPAIVALSSTAFALACESSKVTSPVTDSGFSTGGSTGGRGGSGTGGSHAGGSGGRATDAGVDASGDASPDATLRADGSADGSVAQEAGVGPADSLCKGAVDAGGTGHVVLAAGTDYVTKTEVATVDLGRGCVVGRATFADGDAVPVASAGRGFVLERTNAALDVLAANGTVARRIDFFKPDGGDSPNPHDVVVIPGTSTAYVPMYHVNEVAIVDVDTGALQGAVDLSSLADPADTDGSVDADRGFYDPVTGYVYLTLQRIDLKRFVCTGVKGLLIAIDPKTNTLVDLNGGASGVGIELSLVSGIATPDLASRRVLLASGGCVRPTDGGGAREMQGVESVSLETYTTTVLYSPTGNEDFISGIAVLGPNKAAIDSFRGSDELWNEWATTSAVLGAKLTGVPANSVSLQADTLVGLTFTGHPAVTQYTASTQAATVLVAFPWEGAFTSGAGMAVVR